jgi:hypothetical protein
MKLVPNVVPGAAACPCALADGPVEVSDPGLRPELAGSPEPVSGVDPDYFASLRAAFKEVYSIAGDRLPFLSSHRRIESSPESQIAMAKASGARSSIPGFLKPYGTIHDMSLKSQAGLTREFRVAPLFTIAGRSDPRKCVFNQPDFSNIANLSFRIPAFGAGMIESIPDSVILSNRASRARAKQELGISDQYSLARFTGEAYETGMFLPNSYSSAPCEPLAETCLSLCGNAYGGPANYSGCYGSNFGDRGFLFTEFMRYLRPPEPVESFPGASAQSVEHGRRLFNECGM